MVTIRTYFNIAEAGCAHSLLEAMGIRAFLHGENSFTMEPTPAIGLRLQVAEEDVEAARSLLTEHGGVVPLPDDFEPPTDEVSEDTRPKR